MRGEDGGQRPGPDALPNPAVGPVAGPRAAGGGSGGGGSRDREGEGRGPGRGRGAEAGWRARVPPCTRSWAPAPEEVRVAASPMALSPRAGPPTSTPPARAPDAPPSPPPPRGCGSDRAREPVARSLRPVARPPLLCPVSPCAPHPRVGSQFPPVFVTSAFLAGAGDRARCYLPPPPPARALRATPPTPRDFQGSPQPNPAKCRAPSSGQALLGRPTKNVQFLLFSLYPVTQSQGLESEGGRKKGTFKYKTLNLSKLRRS